VQVGWEQVLEITEQTQCLVHLLLLAVVAAEQMVQQETLEVLAAEEVEMVETFLKQITYLDRDTLVDIVLQVVVQAQAVEVVLEQEEIMEHLTALQLDPLGQVMEELVFQIQYQDLQYFTQAVEVVHLNLVIQVVECRKAAQELAEMDQNLQLELLEQMA
jgi:hypothetical protein